MNSKRREEERDDTKGKDELKESDQKKKWEWKDKKDEKQ